MSQPIGSNADNPVDGTHPSDGQLVVEPRVIESEHAQWLSMYEQMLKIRIFEEHVNELYTERQNARSGPPLQWRRGHSCRRM